MNKKKTILTLSGIFAFVFLGASVAVQAAENPFAFADNGKEEVLAIAPPSSTPDAKAGTSDGSGSPEAPSEALPDQPAPLEDDSDGDVSYGDDEDNFNLTPAQD